MPIEIRAAALCVFWQADCFLVAEIVDPLTGARLHRPPGGGIEEGESPEQAVVREVREELSIALAGVRCLGAIDHVWHWNGREVHERAWIFVPDPPVMNWPTCAEPPEIIEADGACHRTLWRPLDPPGSWPPLCPSGLEHSLRRPSAQPLATSNS